MRPVLALRERHDAEGRISEHHGRQVGREQGAFELVDTGCVGDRSMAELGDASEVGCVEEVEVDHVGRIRIAPGPGIVESSLNWARARSRFCSGRLTR